MKSLTRELRASARADRERWWRELTEEMERAMEKKDWRMLFRNVRRLRGRRIVAGLRVKGPNGEVQSGTNALNRWKEYFRGLLGNETTASGQSVDGVKSRPYMCRDDPPDLVEVSQALRAVKFGKAAGPDGVSAELLRSGGVWVEDWLVRLFRKVWRDGVVPEEWEDAVLVPVHKKGDGLVCGNFRG